MWLVTAVAVAATACAKPVVEAEPVFVDLPVHWVTPWPSRPADCSGEGARVYADALVLYGEGPAGERRFVIVRKYRNGMWLAPPDEQVPELKSSVGSSVEGVAVAGRFIRQMNNDRPLEDTCVVYRADQMLTFGEVYDLHRGLIRLGLRRVNSVAEEAVE